MLVSATFQFFASATLAATGGNIGSGLNQNHARIYAVVNSARFSFRVRQTTAKYRIALGDIDGSGNVTNFQYVDKAGTTANIAGGDDHIQVDCTSIGGKKARFAMLEIQSNGGFIGIYTSPGDTVVAPTKGFGAIGSNLRISFFGDSFVGLTGPVFPGDGYPVQLAERLGGTYNTFSGVGGSGWLAKVGSVYNFGERLSDMTVLAPFDFGFFAFGINDGTSGIQAAALADLQYARRIFPRAPLHVTGAWNTSAPSAPSATVTSVIAQTRAAVAQIPGARFLDATNLVFDHSGDGTHPTDPTGSSTISDFVYADVQTWLGLAP